MIMEATFQSYLAEAVLMAQNGEKMAYIDDSDPESEPKNPVKMRQNGAKNRKKPRPSGIVTNENQPDFRRNKLLFMSVNRKQRISLQRSQSTKEVPNLKTKWGSLVAQLNRSFRGPTQESSKFSTIWRRSQSCRNILFASRR